MNSLSTELEKLHDKHVDNLLKNIHEDSPRLYHYTSLQNALDIIQKQVLRFTNVLYLNDPTELQLGLQIAEEVIIKLIREYSKQEEKIQSDVLAEILAQFIIGFSPPTKRKEQKERLVLKFGSCVSETIKLLLDKLLSVEEWSLYVACLSANNDDLRQWLPYADDARGVAIGFKPMSGNSHQITNHTQRNIWIVSVCYTADEKKKEYLEIFIRDALSVFSKTTDRGEFLQKMKELLLVDLVACKNPHYKDEQEWRLFFVQSAINYQSVGNDDIPRFYIKNNVIKPYYDVPLKTGAIIDIKFGALCDEMLNKDAMMMLLQNNPATSGTSISKSRIDYRG